MIQDGKVAVRNIRRESVDKIKAAEKDKDIGKDDSKGFQVFFKHFTYARNAHDAGKSISRV